MNKILSTGIIGGSDGPTAVFLAGTPSIGVMIASVVMGLLLCFLGLKVTKVIATIIGFAIGAAAGVAINSIAGSSGMVAVAIIFVAAVIFAVLSFFVYRLGIFFMAFSVVGGIAYTMVDTSVSLYLIIALVVTLILSIVAVIFMEPVIIVITACSGGVMAGTNIAGIAGFADDIRINAGISVVLIILGLIVQFILYSKAVGKKDKLHSKKVKEKDSMETEVEKARLVLDDEDEVQEDEQTVSGDDFDDIEIVNDIDDGEERS